MRLGSGIANMRAMLEHHVNVGIGTDGSSSSDNQNMYEAMRFASFASKVRQLDPGEWMTTREVFSAATVGGAKLIGMDGHLGRIAPGYKADLVFLDRNAITMIPLNDAYNALVHCEDGSAVTHVMVGGDFKVRDGRIVHVDREALRKRAESAVERLARLNMANKALFEALEGIVTSYCVGLARMPYPIDMYGARN